VRHVLFAQGPALTPDPLPAALSPASNPADLLAAPAADLALDALAPGGALALVLHDVAPATWERCAVLLQQACALAPLPATLLVVPRWHGEPSTSGFQAAMNTALAQGHELALHGWSHLDPLPAHGALQRLRRRFYTAGEGEFAALPCEQAARRLALGRRWFARRGWPLHGFVPPAWLLGAGSARALAEAGFEYSCTLDRFIGLRGQVPLRAWSLVFSTRAAWRRGVSRVWVPLLARRLRKAPLLRFELHPDDVVHPEVRRCWLALLAQALEQGRQPLLLREVAQRLPRATKSPAGPGFQGEW
jgi:predicted deacetylase